MSEEAKAPFSDGEVAKDTIFDLLSSPRRRFILYYLHEEGDGLTLQELADEVGAWEYEKPIDELTSQERKRVYVSLYQTHIPKLEDSGVIEYDADSGMIDLTSHIDEFGPYLGWEQSSRAWQAVYLGIALVSILFYAAVTFDIGPFAAISQLVAGLTVVATFVAVAIWQYFTSPSGVRMPDELIEER